MSASLLTSITRSGTHLAESGLVPDLGVRLAIRRLVRERRAHERRNARTTAEFAELMRTTPVAVHEDDANSQHYEVASSFFEHVLGPRLKYSCALFGDGIDGLPAAEDAMLELSCSRARIEDGMRILDLGCGWGSFTTYAAEHYPNSEILAVSNSRSQRQFITERCRRRGFDRVEVVTANAATLELEGGFDRVVSIEMFEHMRNWHVLYERIARCLRPDGRFFQHVFCHREHPYFFEDDSEGDWMARNFFSGGIMPSFDLPRAIPGALEVEEDWRVGGRHYARTARAWLDRLDDQHDEALHALRDHPESADVALQRWRMFFMACEELFGFDEGQEWFVGHYRLRKAGA